MRLAQELLLLVAFTDDTKNMFCNVNFKCLFIELLFQLLWLHDMILQLINVILKIAKKKKGFCKLFFLMKEEVK